MLMVFQRYSPKSCSIFSVFFSKNALQNSSSLLPSFADVSRNHSLIFLIKRFFISLLGIAKRIFPSAVRPCFVRYPVVKSTLHRFPMFLSSSSYVSSCESSFSIHSPAIRRSISSLVCTSALSINLRTIAFPLELDQ